MTNNLLMLQMVLAETVGITINPIILSLVSFATGALGSLFMRAVSVGRASFQLEQTSRELAAATQKVGILVEQVAELRAEVRMLTTNRGRSARNPD